MWITLVSKKIIYRKFGKIRFFSTKSFPQFPHPAVWITGFFPPFLGFFTPVKTGKLDFVQKRNAHDSEGENFSLMKRLTIFVVKNTNYLSACAKITKVRFENAGNSR